MIITQGVCMAQNEVPIKIDKKNLKTPPQTTGAALYLIGEVEASIYDLWLEIPGSGEDQFIPNDGSSIEIKPGSHFYTIKKSLNPGNARYI